MTKAMRTILIERLAAIDSTPKHDASVGQRVVARLLDKAMAGDLTAVRLIFEVVDGPTSGILEAFSQPLLPRPAIERLDPND